MEKLFFKALVCLFAGGVFLDIFVFRFKHHDVLIGCGIYLAWSL